MTSPIPSWQVGSILLTSYPYSVDRDDGVDVGEPEMVVESLASMLADGDLERTVRHGNRTYVIPVYIEGPDLMAVAQAEADLRSELKRTGLVLTHDPGDGGGPASAYDVLTAQMVLDRSDTFEIHKRRKWTLTLTCAPFARSVDLATVPAIAGGAYSSVLVDDCSSAVGWTGKVGDVATAPIVDSGVLLLTGDRSEPVEFTRAGAVDFSATRYMVVETTGMALWAIYATVGGVERSLPILRNVAIAGGHRLLTVDTGGVAVSSLRFYTIFHDVGTFGIADVSRSATMPQVTPRQITRVLETGGTERTFGSLRVSSPDGTSPLTLTIVATWPESGAGFSPPLRRWRGGGNTAGPLAGTFSGMSEPLSPAYVYFDVPVDSLPVGTYQLMALMSATVAGSYAVESVIQSRYDGATLGETTWGIGGTEMVSFPLADDWKLVPMGVYRIPIAAAKAGEFRILIKTPDTGSVYYDEAWLFPVDDDCALSAALVTEPHLWLDSPDLESTVPRVWEGASEDKTDAHWPKNGIHTMGRHVFTPGGTTIFAASRDVDYPEVTVSYHKRWHSNAAED